MWTGSVDVTDDLELVSPGPDEVLVRIVSAGVCHSDLSVIDGTIQFPTPAVLGHEGAGIVEGVGSSVTLVKPGDHVVLITMEYCGACAQCDAGRPTLCLNQTNRIINNRPFTYKGEAAYAFANTGVFYSFECVGRPALIRQTIDMLAPGGTCVVIGTTPLGSEVAF